MLNYTGVIPLVAVIGCGVVQAPPTRDVAKPSHPTPGGVLVTNNCPTPEKLAAHLMERTGKRVEVVACREGRFPEPGWAIVSWLDSNESPDAAILFVHLLAQEGPRLGPELVPEFADDGGPSFRVNIDVLDLLAVDLNGDGVDEVLRFETLTNQGADDRFLRVFKFLSGELKEVLSFQYAADNRASAEYGAIVCTASVRISDPDRSGKRVINVDGQLLMGNLADVSESGCIIGHKHFEIE